MDLKRFICMVAAEKCAELYQAGMPYKKALREAKKLRDKTMNKMEFGY